MMRIYKSNKENKGITLVALVITIILLLILAGITIVSLTGNNGLINKATQAKNEQIKAEMKEKLILTISDLQIEKEGKATLEDITQEWLNEKIRDYETTIEEDTTKNEKKIKMEKDGVIQIFIIKEDLIIEEYKSNIKFTYEVKEENGEIAKLLINVQDNEYGIEKIELPNMQEVNANGEKEVGIDYEVEIGKEYKVKITSTNGYIKTETILINIEKTYLYKLGEEYTELTGGWEAGANNAGTFLKENDHLNITATSSASTNYHVSGCQTSNSININEFSKIKYKFKIHNFAWISREGLFYSWMFMGISNAKLTVNNSREFIAYKLMGYVEDFSNQIITEEVDIKDLQGDVFPTIMFSKSYNKASYSLNIDIYEVWLEKII